MLGSLLTILGTTLSLLVVDIIFPGVNIANFPAALIAAASIGVINAGVKPTLSLLSLPLNIVSLGAFSLVINGLCFWLASILVPGFRVAGLIAFIVAPLILSFVNTLINRYFGEKFSTIKQ
jgi:putative membrane protein